MKEQYMLDGLPYVDVTHPKFGKVAFALWSATRGTAFFSRFKLRGVEYGGSVAFVDQRTKFENPENCQKRGRDCQCDKTHVASPVAEDYANSYLRREHFEQPTDATRRDVWAFVEAEAAKLFADAELVKIAHVAEVDRMVADLEAQLTAVREKETGIVERLTERRAQAKLGTPFCSRQATKYGTEVCSLPLGHKGAHDGERKR